MFNSKAFIHFVRSFFKALCFEIPIILVAFIMIVLYQVFRPVDIQSLYVGIVASVLSSIIIRMADRYSRAHNAMRKIYAMANEALRCSQNLSKNGEYNQLLQARIDQIGYEISLYTNDLLIENDKSKAMKLQNTIEKIPKIAEEGRISPNQTSDLTKTDENPIESLKSLICNYQYE